MKLETPEKAAATLALLGDWPTQLALVRFVSILETAIGLYVLVVPRVVVPTTCAAVVCLALVVGRVLLGGAAEVKDCGCFGRLPVGSTTSLAILVVASSVFVHAAWSARQAAAHSGRGAIGSVALLLLAATAFGLRSPSTKDPRERIASLARLAAKADVYVVIGRWDCTHCIAKVETLLRTSKLPIRFVVSESETSLRPRIATHPRLHEILIPDDDWWSCVDDTPPIVWRWVDGKIARRS